MQSWEFPKEEEILPVNRNVSPYLRALAALPDNLPNRFWISLVSPPSQISQLLAVNLLIYASCCFYFSGYSSKENDENTTCWALKNCLGTVTIAMSSSAISISKGLHKWESGWNCGVGGKRLSMLLLQGIHTPWKWKINFLESYQSLRTTVLTGCAKSLAHPWKLKTEKKKVSTFNLIHVDIDGLCGFEVTKFYKR